MKRGLLLICFLALRVPQVFSADNPELLRFPIAESELANGMKVILIEEHKAPVATFQVWYQVGSRNERTGKTGLSHLMEHMMFKGTPTYGKGVFSRTVQKNGGNDNAFTAQDYTAYFENISSRRLGVSIDLESDRMGHLLIDPEEFRLERDVVKEERRMSTDDSPTDYLAELLNAEAFVAHPYHAPIIGWMTDLDHLTREDVYRHYKQYYIPNNATIVAAGDFKSADLLEQIRKAFESIPAGEKIPPVQITEPEQKGERRFVVRKPAQIPAVMIGFKAPNFKDADHFPLTVLSTILSSGKSSRLYQQLVYEKKIALEVESDYSELSADPSLFTFAGKPQQGKTAAELETAILTEIEKVRSDRCGEEEIQKAKNLIETQFILSRDSNFFVAMQLGTAASVGAGTRYFDHYIESIRAVSADDIQRVARKYLIADSRTTGILEPVSDSAPGKD